MYRQVALIFMLLGFQAQAHEMTPAYPKFNYSYIEGVSVTKMFLKWNNGDEFVARREKIEFFEATQLFRFFTLHTTHSNQF